MKNKKILSGVLAATVLFGANAAPIANTIGSGLVAFADIIAADNIVLGDVTACTAAAVDASGTNLENVKVEFKDGAIAVTLPSDYDGTTVSVTVTAATVAAKDKTDDAENPKEITNGISGFTATATSLAVGGSDLKVTVTRAADETDGYAALTKDINVTITKEEAQTPAATYVLQGEATVTLKKGEAAVEGTTAKGADGTLTVTVPKGTEGELAVTVEQNAKKGEAAAVKASGTANATVGATTAADVTLKVTEGTGDDAEEVTVGTVKVLVKAATEDSETPAGTYTVTIANPFESDGVTASADKTTAAKDAEIIVTVSGVPEGKVADVQYQNADNNTATFTTTAVDGETNKFKFTMPEYNVKVLIMIKEAPAEGGDDNGDDNEGGDNTNNDNNNNNNNTTTTTPSTTTPSTSSDATSSDDTSSAPAEEVKPDVTVSSIPTAEAPAEVKVEAAVVESIVGATEEEVQKFVEDTFTAEEIAAAGEGAKVEVAVQVSSAPETEEVKAAVETITTAFSSEYEIGEAVEINLVAILGEAKKNLTEPGAEVTITLPVPAGMQGKNVALAREHNGKAEILEDKDDDPNTITISSDKFSTYAFVTKKAESGAETNVPTGIALGVTPVLLAGAAVTVAVLKRKSK